MRRKKLSIFQVLVLTTGALAVFSSSCAGVYVILTTAMKPTFFQGDRVLVNKLAYGLILPLSQTFLVRWGQPGRGDIVLFLNPRTHENSLQRIIGLPGETILFQDNVLTIDGIPVTMTAMQKLTNAEENGFSEESAKFGLPPHLLLLSKETPRTFFETRRFVVPPHRYFVLGDNRDHAVDSRVFGFVDEKQILGRAQIVLFATAGENRILPRFLPERFWQSVSFLNQLQTSLPVASAAQTRSEMRSSALSIPTEKRNKEESIPKDFL